MKQQPSNDFHREQNVFSDASIVEKRSNCPPKDNKENLKLPK